MIFRKKPSHLTKNRATVRSSNALALVNSAIQAFFLPQKYYTNNQVYGNVATNLGVYFCRIFIAHSKVKREG